MITNQDKLSAEQEAEQQYWEQVEAKARHHEWVKRQEEANARLIAAAADMLEALGDIFRAQLCPEPKTMKGWIQRNDTIDRIVRNALNKAEGSTL